MVLERVEELRPFTFIREAAGVVTDTTMSREEIERTMEEAGWRLDSGFAEYLIVGHNDRASILAPRWVWELDDPVFELCDEQKDVTYWVNEIPTPQQAVELLKEHGGPPEEQRGNPYDESAGGNGEQGHDG